MKAIPGADSLTEQHRQDLVRRMDDVKHIEDNFCTACGYCKECPSGVNPTRFMKIMRDFVRYGVAPDRLRHWLLSQTPHSNIRKELSQCTACAQCEQKCPQHLKIVEQIEKAKQALGI